MANELPKVCRHGSIDACEWCGVRAEPGASVFEIRELRSELKRARDENAKLRRRVKTMERAVEFVREWLSSEPLAMSGSDAARLFEKACTILAALSAGDGG